MLDLLDYNVMIERAVRTVIRDIIKKAGEDGLSNDRQIILSFITKANGVIVPDFLLRDYPDEITIILQYQFEIRELTEKYFTVNLSFGRKYEDVTIPFSSISAFLDPDAGFSLKFLHFDDNKKEGEKLKKDIFFSDKLVSIDDFKKNK